ncbi:MAG: hypothetical protein ACLFWL_05900 [Candidatus Brocadiia bacterium]
MWMRKMFVAMVLVGLWGFNAMGQEKDTRIAILEPTDAARRTAPVIRREALLPPNGPKGRPLPLASHWNVGAIKGSFEPEHQIELIQEGHHILPWSAWLRRDPQSRRFQEYRVPLFGLCRKLKLPLSFRGTQWESILVKKKYREGPEQQWTGVITPDGKRKPQLSPFGPIEPWKDPAEVYVDNAAMKWAQEFYPDTPLILWYGNNEAPHLRWKKHGPLEKQSARYLEKYGEGRSDEFKRKVVGDGWMERYEVLLDAMRNALVNKNWRENVRIIGYGAFGPSHFGRWGGWQVYSSITSERVAWDWFVWDGGSPSYYTHNWNDNRDHWVFSTQVQAMNWVFMLDRAWKSNPNFWFEMSTWDGNNVKMWMKGLGVEEPENLVAESSEPLTAEEKKQMDKKCIRKSKTIQYMMDGQTYPPERVLGWVQYGMWLLRPRVVREFRGHTTPLRPVKTYWMQTVKAVDRVYENETLKEFWRHGELVHNRERRHPYQSAIPEAYKDIHRWFLLDTDLDPERPWKLKTNVPVFSLALVLGEKEQRRWLVYAHSPLDDRDDVGIKVPDFGQIKVDVPRAGAFFVVEEKSGKVSRIND